MDRWDDFLENGHLHWHDDPTRFSFETLSAEQMRSLLAFLEQQYGRTPKPPPLLDWLRVRRAKSG
jgi:hypothetical protein